MIVNLDIFITRRKIWMLRLERRFLKTTWLNHAYLPMVYKVLVKHDVQEMRDVHKQVAQSGDTEVLNR